jgi:hypothetical protein
MAIADFVHMFPDTVTYREYTGFDAHGKPQYSGDAISYTARVVYITRRVTSMISGEEVVSNTSVWVADLESVSVHGELTLPDGTKPKILSWEKYPDARGFHHVKIFVSRRN